MVATIVRDALRTKTERGENFTLVEVLLADIRTEGHRPGG